MSKEKIVETLTTLGFTDLDAKIYIYFAKRGPKRASEARKSLKISKQQLYPVIKKLQSKGVLASTLERPARFSALPFESVLDSFVKVKLDEARQIQRKKDDLLSTWKSISLKEKSDRSDKFTVIEGKNHVYSKMKQMIESTKQQLLTVTTVPGLIRADQHGLLDVAFDHPLKSIVNFRFLTDISEHNIDSMKLLLEKGSRSGFDFKGKNPSLGLQLSPRMVIRDNKELLFFVSPQGEDDSCLWTTCKELVNSFVVVFEDLWRTSTDIQDKLRSIENKPEEKSGLISEKKLFAKNYIKLLGSAKNEIIELVSSDGLLELNKNVDLLKKCAKRHVSIRIMAPITSGNLSAVHQLSKFCTVKHVPVSYLRTSIIDRKHLFQSKIPTIYENPLLIDRQPDNFYTTEPDYVEKRRKILDQIWDNSNIPSVITLESITQPKTPTIGSVSKKINPKVVKKVQGVTLLEEEKPLENLTAKDVLNIIFNSKRYPVTSSSNNVTRFYGTHGQAIVHMPNNLNLPDILFHYFHFEKNSEFGAEDAILVMPWLDTPGGKFYVPIAFVGDNIEALNYQKKMFSGMIHDENFRLFEKDEIQVRIQGDLLFCGWTKPIPLTVDSVLPPASIILEGIGDIITRTFEVGYPSGYKMWNLWNGLESFVTFLHPTSKYSGPGTDGLIIRDSIIEIYPP